MSSSDHPVVPARKIGTGSKLPLEVMTYGQRRFVVRDTEPVIEAQLVSADPVATPKPGFFFRDNGAGKQQFCVRFKTGAIQILATEP